MNYKKVIFYLKQYSILRLQNIIENSAEFMEFCATQRRPVSEISEHKLRLVDTSLAFGLTAQLSR